MRTKLNRKNLAALLFAFQMHTRTTLFDFQVEAKANSFDQFTTYIDGINVHYFHVKPKDPKGKQVLPLLMVHGWPGSFLEFLDILPMLTTPRDDADFVFEVVVPSIPGFGFSDAPGQPEYNAREAARQFKELMVERLGFNKFYAQGGDWGSFITGFISVLYPEHVIGYHTNFAQANSIGSSVKRFVYSLMPSLLDSDEERKMIEDPMLLYKESLIESGYLHIQATKPDTLGASLTTSPTGLMAWILEKFSTATNMAYREKYDGGLTEKFTKDELLANVMLYWVTLTGGTSARFYYENFGRADSHLFTVSDLPIRVPTGIAVFPNELAIMPKKVLENRYRNIVAYNVMESGGHFAALEEPTLLANDIFAFVNIVKKNLLQRQSTKGEL